MAFPNPFSVPNVDQSPYLQSLAGVGGAYNSLLNGATGPLVDASGNLINAGQANIGPGEFDPTVAALLSTSRNPVNNDLEDYFFQKYMADANNRVANRGLIGQGAGEGLLNQAAKDYSYGRADTALGRQISSGNAASALRTGQVGRAASLTGAGLAPYDTLQNLLRGQGNVYGNTAELNMAPGLANARNRTALTPTYLNAYGTLLNSVGKSVGGLYDQFTAPSDTSASSIQPGGDGGGTEVAGGFYDATGGRVPGKGAYDHVRAILTPHEFVIKRPVAEKARGALESLNAGDFSGAARKLARSASVAR